MSPILEVLNANPTGLTSHEVSAMTGLAYATVSSKLSKLAAYGVIDKIGKAPVGAVWKAKDRP